MPTRWTQSLIPTSRQVPAEAVVPSHQLMLRAGFIHKLGAGVYDYLPLGLRSLRKVMDIVRQEMDRAGAVEVLLPTFQPIELWEQTGRRTDYGGNLFVVNDRHASTYALGPTHEEVVTELVGSYVESYKQLPVTLYQIQTKFRDEFRPRFGVLRSREFQMKDAYSFHLNLEGPGGLDETYQKQFDAYCRIFKRCGLPYEIVEAESGPIGGSASHEFMVPSPTGEDTILKSDTGNYAANVEKCEIGPRVATFDGEPTGELEEVHTPGCASIEDVTAFFKKQLKTKLKPQNMLKTLVCQCEPDKWVIGVVRGDHEMNIAKLRAVSQQPGLDLAEDPAARQAGFAIGFVGPQVMAERSDVTVYVDHDAAQAGFWVTGANDTDKHVKHFNWKRDLAAALGDAVSTQLIAADIRNATDCDPAPDGGTLHETKGIEIGHVFKLGDKYTRAMDVTVLDDQNERRNPIMGCYGIGVNRILAAAVERDTPGHLGHDENGIIWPVSIAPFTVIITPIKYEGRVREVTDQLAEQIESLPGLPGVAEAFDVLIDDRDERPGVKFNDADLIGIPLRITVGEKALAEGNVEIKRRTDSPKDAEHVPIDQAPARVAELLSQMAAGVPDAAIGLTAEAVTH